MEKTYFEFEWNGILIALNYHSDQYDVIDLITLETIDPPRAPLPMSDKGTYCHHLHLEDMNPYGGDPVKYVTSWLDYAAQSPAWQRQQDTAAQYSLF